MNATSPGDFLLRLADFGKQTSLKNFVLDFVFYAQNRIGSTFFRESPPDGGEWLNLGCGQTRYQGWVNADCYDVYAELRSRKARPDWRLDVTRPWNCPADRWSGVFTEHTLEHLSYRGAVAALHEAYRTLRAGGRIRIVLPDLKRYVRFYTNEDSGPEFSQFVSPALGLASLAQQWGHASLWDADLLIAVLGGIGFADAIETAYGDGADTRLVKDSEARKWESFYVEARKPETP